MGKFEPVYKSRLRRLEDRVLLNATPEATVSDLPDDQFVNEDFQFSVTFDNVADVNDADPNDTGYGPFVDVTVGPGIDVNDVSYLGASVQSAQIATWDGSQWVDGAGNPVTQHPLDKTGGLLEIPDGAALGLDMGAAWLNVLAPFGSYTPDQPALDLVFSATMTESPDGETPSGAVPGQDILVTARGGFQFGNDALDNPTDDAPEQQDAAQSDAVTPIVMRLEKAVQLPENETAQGPNFTFTYTISVDIANGVTVTDLNIRDQLPANLFFLAADAPGADSVEAPGAGEAQGVPGIDTVTEATFTYATTTGTTGAGDIVITLTAYAPEFAADGTDLDQMDVDSPTSYVATNNAEIVSANYMAPDGSTIPIDSAISDQLQDSIDIAIRPYTVLKTVGVEGGGAPTPGKYLEFNVDFGVSDYLALQNGVVNDTLSDGLTLDTTNNGTLDHAAVLRVEQNGATFFFQLTTTTGPNKEQELATSFNQADGTQALTFFLSAAVRNSGAADETLYGDLFLNDGDQGPTKMTLTYYALVEETYRARPSAVVVNDVLGNTVGATFDSATSGDEAQSDGSDSSVTVDPPDATKTVYAVNGVIGAQANIAPGDVVTYRLRIALSSLDVNELTITDYLPSPVYDVNGDPDASGFDFVAPGGLPNGIPGAYQITVGPDDVDALATFLAGTRVGVTPALAGELALTFDDATNALLITFPDFDQDASQGGVIDLLYTIPAQDKPFADGLLLVNQAVITTGDSQVVIANTQELVGEVTLFQPVLDLTKGAVATDADGAVDNSLAFTPDDTNPTNVTFTLGAAGFTTSSPLTSDQLDATPISSDLSGIDAGDTVKFAIAVRNTGGQDAFDVIIRDMIPQFDFGNGLENAFDIVGGGLLDVRYGDGTAAAFSGDINDLFGAGIELTDAAGIGALSADGSDDGRNIVLVTYELVARQPLQPQTDNVNGAVLDNYAAIEGGTDFTEGVDGDFTDQVTLTSQGVTVDKQLIDTDQAFTTGDDFAIGEIGTFQITVTAPDGTTAATITDALPDGFELVAGTLVLRLGSFDGTVSQSGSTLSDGALLTFTAGPGNDFVIDFDEIIANAAAGTTLSGQSFIIEYQAQALDDPALNAGDRATNTGTLDTPTTDPVSDNVGVDIVEPNLTITKTFTPDAAQANETVGMQLVVTNGAGTFDTTAFGLTLTDDDLPMDVFSNVVSNSLTGTGGVQAQIDAGLVTVDIDNSDPTNWIVTVTADPTFAIAKGEKLVLDFSLTIQPDVELGDTVDNTATVESYSSLSGEQLVERIFGPTSGSDTLTISGPTIQKYLLNTSLDGEPIAFPLPLTLPVDRTGLDANPNVAVGEVLTYALQVAFPRGVAENVIAFDDTDFLNALGAQGIVNIVSVDQLVVGNALTLDAALTEADVMILDPDGDGIFNRLEFTIGQVANGAGVSDPVNALNESVFIVFRAQVMNVPETDGGDVHLNGARVTYQIDSNDDDVIDGSDATLQFDDSVQITVTEPAIDVAKSVTGAGPNLDAGDDLTYTLTISHNGTSTGDGYALNVIDQLPDDVEFAPGSFVVNGFSTPGFDGLAMGDVTYDAGTNQVRISGFDLPRGQAVSISYHVRVADAVVEGEDLTNEVTLTYQSLPDFDPADGYDPSRPLVTDFTTSLDPNDDGTYLVGAVSQTRDGSDMIPRDQNDPVLVNNYYATTDLTVTIADPGPIVKTVDKPTATIGEIVTYTITIPLIEGTTVNAVIADTLPDGVTFVPGTGSVVNGDGNPVDPTLFTFQQNGQTLTIMANDDVVLNADNNMANDFVRITYQARVDNVVENQNNDAKTNSAAWTHDNGGSLDSATITIVEPNLIYSKTNDAAATVDAGDTIAFTVTAKHSSSSTADAFDIYFTDTLPDDLSELAVVSAALGGQDVSSEVVIQGQQISILGASGIDIPLGATLQLVYTAVVQDSVGPGETLSNSLTGGWTSLDGTNDDSGDADGERTGALDDDLNDYIDTAATSVITDNVLQLNKSASVTEATIGDTVTYYLDVKVFEGTLQNVSVSDLIEPGLRVVGPLRIESVGAGFAGAAPTIVNPVINTNVPNQPGSVLITFTLDNDGDSSTDGTLINPGDPIGDATDNDTIRIAYDVVVTDVLTNQNGEQIDNAAGVEADNTPLATGAESLAIVEPEITVTKTLLTDPAQINDAGDVATYQVVLENVGTSDAFDVAFSDTAPADTSFSGDVVDENGVVVGGFTVAAGTITGAIDRIAVGDSVTLVYSMTVSDTITSGAALTNAVDVRWTSTAGANPDERTGADGHTDDSFDDDGADDTDDTLDNYQGQDDVTIQLDDFSISLEKTLIDTDVAATTGTDLTIGETGTYQLDITVSEGTINGLMVVDVTDAWMDIDTASLTVIGSGFAGGTVNITNVTLDANPTTGVATLSFMLDTTGSPGQIVNPGDNDATNDTISLTYSATVLNNLGNQDGDAISNTATVSADTVVDASDDEVINVVEPRVLADKSIVSLTPAINNIVDAGDVIGYQVILLNSGSSTAFDVEFSDIAPTNTTFTGTVTAVDDMGATVGVFAIVNGGAGIEGSGFDMAVGATVTVTYSAVIVDTVQGGDVIQNDVEVEWTSMPGVDAGERTGEGGPGPDDDTVLNNYVDEDSVTAVIDEFPLTVEKSVESSSVDSTTGVQLTIGETATYLVRVNIAEGTTQLTIEDLLLGAQRFVPGSVTFTTGNPGAAVSFDPPVYDPDANTLTVMGVTVTNPGDNDPTNDFVEIRYDAVMENSTSNQDGVAVPNRVTVTSDTTGAQDSAIAIVTIVEPNVAIDKTVTSPSGPVDAGDVITYQVVLTNDGTSGAFDVTFADAAPTGLLFDPASITAVDGGGADVGDFSGSDANTISGVSFDITVGASVTITYTATVQPTVTNASTFVNTATVDWTSTPETTAENPNERTGPDPTAPDPLDDYEASDSATVDADLPISITKTLISSDIAATTGDRLTIGETATYRLDIAVSEGTVNGLSVVDITDAWMDIDTSSLAVTGLAFGGGTVNVTNVVLIVNPVTGVARLSFMLDTTGTPGQIVNPGDNNPANDTIRLTYSATVLNNLGNQRGDVISNTATVSAGDGVANDAATETINVVEPDLIIEKDARLPLVVVGGTAFYQIRVSHSDASTADAFDLVVSDPFTTELLTVNDGSVVATVENGSGAATVVYANGGFRLNLDKLELGATLVIDFTATSQIIAGADGSTAPNTSTLAYDSIPDVQTPDEQRDYSDSAQAVVTVTGPDLVLMKDASVALVLPGDLFTYDIQVMNLGAPNIDIPLVETARNVVFSDVLPEDVELLSASVDGVDTPFTFNPTTRLVTIALANVPPDVTRIITLFMQAADTFSPATAGGTGDVDLLNVAAVTMRQTDPTPENNIDDATVTTRGVPDLVVEKSSEFTTIGGGDVGTYTITARNVGDRAAGNVQIVDRIDTNVFEFVSANRGGVYDAASGTVTWTLATLAPGDGIESFALRLRVLPGLPSTLDETTNVVDIADDGAAGPDPTPDNNTDAETDGLVYPDLTVGKTSAVAQAGGGDMVEYRIDAANVGDHVAYGVQVVDRIDTNVFEFASASDGGVFDAARGTVTWTIGRLAPEDGAQSFTLELRVRGGLSAEITETTNNVAISGDDRGGREVRLDNNTDAETDGLIYPDLVITKSNTLTEVSPGDLIDYQITVRNVGDFQADGVKVVDVLDARIFRFVSASNGGVFDPATNTVTWLLGTVNPDDPTAVLTLRVEVLFPSTSDIDTAVNTAVVSSDGARGQDADLSNNEDSESDILNAAPDPGEISFALRPRLSIFDEMEDEPEMAYVAPVFTGQATPGAMVSVLLMGANGDPVGSSAAMVSSDGTWTLSMSGVPAEAAPVSAFVTTLPPTVTNLGQIERSGVFFSPGAGGPITFERSYNLYDATDLEAGAVLDALMDASEDPFSITSRRSTGGISAATVGG